MSWSVHQSDMWHIQAKYRLSYAYLLHTSGISQVYIRRIFRGNSLLEVTLLSLPQSHLCFCQSQPPNITSLRLSLFFTRSQHLLNNFSNTFLNIFSTLSQHFNTYPTLSLQFIYYLSTLLPSSGQAPAPALLAWAEPYVKFLPPTHPATHPEKFISGLAAS